MEWKFKKNRWVISFILSAVLLLAFGCQNQSPVSPIADEVVKKSSAIEEYGFNILKSTKQSFSKEFYKQQWIDENGGTIVVGSNAHGFSGLIFPENAVNDQVLVTFWWESTGFLEGGCEFSPHGIQFDVPVILILSYKDADLQGVDETDLKVHYYNEEAGVWEAYPTRVDTENKFVYTQLEHFSRYAIGETP